MQPQGEIFMGNTFGGFLICLVCLAVFGCTQLDAQSNTERAETLAVQQRLTSQIDLISPAICKTLGTRLVRCAIPEQALVGTSIDTAVPLRTVFQINKTGNCSTQYPLEVTVTPSSASGGAPLKIPFLQGGSFALRAVDGGPIPTATLKDSSPWTANAALDKSCSVSASVNWNQVDVDTADQANAIIDKLERIATEKKTIRDQYDALVKQQKAYVFLKSVASNFHSELTNEEMQALRAAGADANVALVNAIVSCAPTDLSEADRMQLQVLHSKLYVLGDPSQWQLDDGGTRTLADFFGPEAQDILRTLDAIAARQQYGELAAYEQLFHAAALEAALAESRIVLARQQLAPFLTP